jgi:hypothetical protein
MSVESKMADSAAQVAKDLGSWMEATALHPIARALEALEIEPTWYNGTLYVSFAGDKHKLADAVRVLRTHDFKTVSEPPVPNAPSWAANFRKPDFEPYVYLSFSSTVCVRKIVRTEMQSVPVYEIVCGDSDQEPAYKVDDAGEIVGPVTTDDDLGLL